MNDHRSPKAPSLNEYKSDVLKLLPALRRFARSLTGNGAASDDLVQDTVLKAIRHERQFKRGSNLRAWLMTIMRNELLSNKRKNWRMTAWNPAFDDSLAFSNTMSEPESAIELHRVLLCMACLPSEQRDALVAVGYAGFSYEEAAERLGCALGTVKSRVYRARLDLSNMMDDATFTLPSLDGLRHMARRFPRSHPFYPIAKAYEDLYATVQVANEPDPTSKTSATEQADVAWENLVASGALDDEEW